MTVHTAKITWKSDSPDTFANNRYTRGHTWSFDGGIEVPGSSSPHVVPRYSVEAAVDPEEALVASAASCHMLTFLYLAATKKFRIDSYEDHAEGAMGTLEDGRQWVAKITLNPIIEWAGDKLPTRDEIDELHHEAHRQCFIANSIKSEIVVKPD
jgi:organic hydroperoxide reductase OsmC/OhrA